MRVAITDAYASPTIAFDAATYAKAHGDAAWKTRPAAPGRCRRATRKTEECGAAGWYGEETLDVEAVHAVAPDANITYVGAASCYDDDLLDSLSKVVDNHLADIVSNSWGDIEANQTPDLAAAYDQVFQFGAVEGIGFYFSSGDNGDEVANTGTKQVDTPANSAWVTAVGGTSLAVGKNDKYLWETGWGTEKASLSADGKSWTGFPGAFTSGAGGGTSKTVAAALLPEGRRPGRARQGQRRRRQRASSRTSRRSPTRTPASRSARPRPSRTGPSSTASTASAAPRWPRRSSRPSRLWPRRRTAAWRSASPTRRSTPSTARRSTTTSRTTRPGPDLAVVRVDFANSIDASGGLLTSVRSLGKDSSLSP